MENNINLKELSEQIQNDLITILDGENPIMIDAICEVVVNRINTLNTSLTK